MIKKKNLIFVFILALLIFIPLRTAFSADYNKHLSKEERQSICRTLESKNKKSSTNVAKKNNNIVPDSVFSNLYDTTKSISDAVATISILGDTLMCHASHAAKKKIEFGPIELASYPDLSIWMCGGIVYFFGFMLLLSIAFYLVDISFKLGMAVVLLPIGIALWPFEWTRDKLTKIISIILKNAAIFIFLALTVSYALNMATTAIGNLDEIFEAINTSNSDVISQTFTLFSIHFLIVVAAFAYGMKLVGSTVPDYVDKFFPDGGFGGGKSSSPIHHSATQMLDFAKKKVAAPVASFAGDVVKTQGGKALATAGKAMRGGYHQQFVKAVHNPKEAVGLVSAKIADKGLNLVSGAGKMANHLKYGAGIAAANLVGGKENRQALKNELRDKRSARDEAIEKTVHEPLRRSMQNMRDRIDDHETERQKEKDKRHADRLANDPKYRAKVQKAKLRALKQANRQNIIADLEAEINTLEKDRKSKLNQVSTGRFNKGANAVADVVKSISPTLLTDAISVPFEAGTKGLNKLQKAGNKGIDKLIPENSDDGLLKWGGKKALRGALKLVPNTLATGLKAGTLLADKALKTPGKIFNGTVDVLNKATQATASGIVNLPGNLKTNAVAGYKKAVLHIKKGFYQVPDALSSVGKGIVEAPGSILERVGTQMQHNKKRGPSFLEDEAERKRLEEEEREEERERNQQWGGD